MQRQTDTSSIDVQGMRFRSLDALDTLLRQDLEATGHAARFPRACLKVARTTDRVLALGAGAGLVPALLAGKLGVPNVLVVEPDSDLRDHLRGVMHDNGLPRVAIAASVPRNVETTFLVADCSRTQVADWKTLPLAGLRAAVLRLPASQQPVTEAFAAFSNAGHTYFPRQSVKDVVTFRARWS